METLNIFNGIFTADSGSSSPIMYFVIFMLFVLPLFIYVAGYVKICGFDRSIFLLELSVILPKII